MMVISKILLRFLALKVKLRIDNYSYHLNFKKQKPMGVPQREDFLYVLFTSIPTVPRTMLGT